MNTLVVRKVASPLIRPFIAGVWRMRPDSARVLNRSKLEHARTLGWDEHATGNMWLTWIGRP